MTIILYADWSPLNSADRIAQLEAENAALKQRNAELVDSLNSYWAECGAVEAVKLPSLESRLLAENAALKAERDELLDTLCNTIDQACDSRMYAAGSAFPGSTHDSMALTAYAEAMFLLERHKRFVVEGDFGRRVIGHFVEVKP